MRQRYLVKIDEDKVLINEYVEWEGQYQLMCTEEHEFEIVEAAVKKDKDSVIRAIRTRNMFPRSSIAAVLADTVINVCNSEEHEEQTVEYDDIDEYRTSIDDIQPEDLIEDELDELTDDLTEEEEIDDGFLEKDDLSKIVPKSPGIDVVDDEDA